MSESNKVVNNMVNTLAQQMEVLRLDEVFSKAMQDYYMFGNAFIVPVGGGTLLMSHMKRKWEVIQNRVNFCPTVQDYIKNSLMKDSEDHVVEVYDRGPERLNVSIDNTHDHTMKTSWYCSKCIYRPFHHLGGPCGGVDFEEVKNVTS